MGYEVRRALHPRPRFRYTVEWLGKRTDEMRVIRDFLMFTRLGTMPFSWWHSTGVEVGVQAFPTSPIQLYFENGHGLYTGMWISIFDSVGLDPAIRRAHPIRVIDRLQLWLMGSTAMGTGTVITGVYFPRAVARFSDDTWPSPVKLIGPEHNFTGNWNFSLQIEEIF
jgi:hypothetical protein